MPKEELREGKEKKLKRISGKNTRKIGKGVKGKGLQEMWTVYGQPMLPKDVRGKEVGLIIGIT